MAVALIFSSPPAAAGIMSNTLGHASTFNFDADAPKIFAASSVYTEGAMSFMTPPIPTNLDALRNRSATMIVVHGDSDPVFSVDDSATCCDALSAQYAGAAQRFVRFFRVPDMGHSPGGPAADQFDAITALVNWVEKGQAPDQIVASARGTGNAGGVNTEVPTDWSPTRSRSLCTYPLVTRYHSGDAESAASFACVK